MRFLDLLDHSLFDPADSPVPMLLIDTDLVPIDWNEPAARFMPQLVPKIPLPEQYPSLHWLTVPSALNLMQPVMILLHTSTACETDENLSSLCCPF